MMRTRASSLIIVGALVFAGCAASGSETSVTEAIGESTDTTGPVAAAETTAPALVDPVTTTVPTTVSSTTTSTTHAATTTARTAVESLASGLFCRDLAPHGYSYAEAVAYWVSEGSPERMDADRNGIPCETVYGEADVLAFWGDPLPTTTLPPARRWYGPSDPWEYPAPDSPDSGVYGSGCSPGSTDLPDGAWFGFVVERAEGRVQFDLACLEIPGEGHATVLNDNPRLRTVVVAEGTAIHHLRRGVEAADTESFEEWLADGCTTREEACAMWIFVNDGLMTAGVEVRLHSR